MPNIAPARTYVNNKNIFLYTSAANAYVLPMNTKRQKRVVTLTLDPDLWDELVAWIAEQDIRHPKNAVVEKAIRKFLDGNGNGGDSAVQIHKSPAKGA